MKRSCLHLSGGRVCEADSPSGGFLKVRGTLLGVPAICNEEYIISGSILGSGSPSLRKLLSQLVSSRHMVRITDSLVGHGLWKPSNKAREAPKV